MNNCKWFVYDDYYETQCSNSMDDVDYNNISPTYCPYCGDKITIEE